jgi:Pentapeptide repeats (8 copies)
MANKDHVEKINQGVGAWNEWRKTNPNLRPNLEGEDLSNRDFTGINLSGARIRGTKFNNSYLKGADLSSIDAGLTKVGGIILFLLVILSIVCALACITFAISLLGILVHNSPLWMSLIMLFICGLDIGTALWSGPHNSDGYGYAPYALVLLAMFVGVFGMGIYANYGGNIFAGFALGAGSTFTFIIGAIGGSVWAYSAASAINQEWTNRLFLLMIPTSALIFSFAFRDTLGSGNYLLCIALSPVLTITLFINTKYVAMSDAVEQSGFAYEIGRKFASLGGTDFRDAKLQYYIDEAKILNSAQLLRMLK